MPEIVAVLDRRRPAAARAIASLTEQGHTVHVVEGAGEADHLVRVLPVDAVVFDPLAAGDDFMRLLRRAHPAQLLVAWTAGSSSPLVAELLEAGADEVLHAGMGEREIAARIAAVLRRGRSVGAPAVELGPLRLDAGHGEASWDGNDLMLTRREREVLEVLAERAGRTVRREVLYRRVWGYAMVRGERGVDVNVKRLRRKLALVAGDELQIKTQPGVGYRLELAAERAPASVTAL